MSTEVRVAAADDEKERKFLQTLKIIDHTYAVGTSLVLVTVKLILNRRLYKEAIADGITCWSAARVQKLWTLCMR